MRPSDDPSSNVAGPSSGPRTSDAPAVTGTLSPPSSLAPEEKQAMFRRAGSLILMGMTLIVVVGVLSLVLIRRHRGRLAAASKKDRNRRPPPPADPWFESGRRVGPGGAGGGPGNGWNDGGRGSDDDTVDLDPDEIGPADVEGDDGADSPEKGRDR